MQALVWPATPPSAAQRRDMLERNAFTDQQIQDYIDGRLNERDRAAVAAYLLAHPRVATDVEAVRRQSDALRALGQEILDAPVPEHLRRIVRERPARPHAEPRPVPPEARQPARQLRGLRKHRCRDTRVLRRRRRRVVRAWCRPPSTEHQGQAPRRHPSHLCVLWRTRLSGPLSGGPRGRVRHVDRPLLRTRGAAP